MRSLSIALGTSLLLLVALPACQGGTGAGGGGDAPQLNIHFATAQMTARFFQGQQYLTNTSTRPVVIQVNGTVDPVPQGQLYVRIVLDAPVFDSDVGVDVWPPDSFELYFTPLMDLQPGTYTGTVTVQVFQDAAMTKPYRVTGGTLAYALTVDPELTVSVKIDGVLQPEIFTSSHFAVTYFNNIGYGTIYWDGATAPAPSYTLHPGQVVELEASVPVTWYGPDRTAGPYGYWFAKPVVTATTLTQTIPSPPGGSSGLSGSSFIAMPVAPGQYGTGFVFDLVAP
jgi:hypothetical protein